MIVGYPESWISSRFKITIYRLGARTKGVEQWIMPGVGEDVWFSCKWKFILMGLPSYHAKWLP